MIPRVVVSATRTDTQVLRRPDGTVEAILCPWDQTPTATLAALHDQLAAAYNDMAANCPKLQATFEMTVDPDLYQRLVDTLPTTTDLVGGPLDGFQWWFPPRAVYPQMLMVEVGQVQHWYRRVECEWWTCYEWVRDVERP